MDVVRDPVLAAQALAAGRLAALPTETVYGLGARADDPHAIARIYAVKGRPVDHPLIVHLGSISALSAWIERVPDYASALAQAYWPGPLTLVLPRSARARDFVTGGQDCVALRIPAHPVLAEVLHLLAESVQDQAVGVAAPSANRFGRVSPTTADHVRAELGEFLGAGDVILDAGPSAVGIESTIVDCTMDTPRLLRPGAITAEMVREVTGLPVVIGSPIRASGTLAAHYAPSARVVIVDVDGLLEAAEHVGATADTGLLALAEIPTPPGLVRLSAPSTPQAYAAALYHALREADDLGLKRVLVLLPPADGIGLAIRDRVGRAAHGSDRPTRPDRSGHPDPASAAG